MLHPNCNFEWHFVLEAIPFTRESVSEKIQKTGSKFEANTFEQTAFLINFSVLDM